jgi:hypothetical protein
MGILLAFAPFIVFAVIAQFASSVDALVAGAVVSAALIARDWVRGRMPKLLEIGTFLLFGVLAIYALAGGPMSVIGVRLCVDAGLLLIVIVSLLIGRPFTMQYAREQVPSEFWNNPSFIRTNYVITSVWALAFVVMVAAELALLYVPGMPRRLGIIAIVVALVIAFRFTGWYPERVRNQGSAQ